MILFLLLSSNLENCDSRISRDRVYRSIDSFLGHLLLKHFFSTEPIFFPLRQSLMSSFLTHYSEILFNVWPWRPLLRTSILFCIYAILNLNPNTCITQWTVASYQLVSLWSYRHHSKLMVFRSLVKLMSSSTFRL